jgi:methylmalonyl-CoA/ethylmalonyl-CoA epimerase
MSDHHHPDADDADHLSVQLSHIGIAVRALSSALPFYRDVLGLPVVPLEDSDGASIAGLSAGQALVELLEPLAPDTPIGKFIDRRGPGIHHVCFSTTDLDGALDRCRAAGVRLIDEVPRLGADGSRIAFVHPSATGGVLVELTQRESVQPPGGSASR